jgi:hypothetical protein
MEVALNQCVFGPVFYLCSPYLNCRLFVHFNQPTENRCCKYFNGSHVYRGLCDGVAEKPPCCFFTCKATVTENDVAYFYCISGPCSKRPQRLLHLKISHYRHVDTVNGRKLRSRSTEVSHVEQREANMKLR